MNIVISNTSSLNTIDKNFKPSYFINNELRFVTPYVYTYKLYTKKRWVGRKIEDILNREFCAYGIDYFKTSIKKGYIKVNKKNITPDYVMKDNDFIEHKLLLFEKPVLYKKILILYEDENFICAHKPNSIPTHPVGFYQYNSLLRILQNYLNFQKIKKEKLEKEVDVNNQFDDVVKIDFLFNFKEMDLKQYEEQMKENLLKIKRNKRSYREKKRNFKEQNSTNDDLSFLCNDLKKKIKKVERRVVNTNILQPYEKDETKDSLDEEISINKNMDTQIIEEEKEEEEKKEENNYKEHQFYLKEKHNDQKTNSIDNIIVNKINVIKEKAEYQNTNESFVEASQINNKDTNNFFDEKKSKKKRDKQKENFIDINEKTDEKNNEKNNEKTDEDIYIYTLHRLDKFTSGITLFGKNKIFSTAFAQQLSNNKIKKTYITRVDGDFRILIKKIINENKIMKFEEGRKLNELVERFCSNDKKKNSKSLKYMEHNVISENNKVDSEEYLQYDQFLYENNYKDDYALNEMKMKKLIDKIKTQKKDLENFFDVSKYNEECFSEQQTSSNTKCQKDKNTLEEEKRKEKKKEGTKEMEDECHKYFLVDFGYMYCQSKKTLKYVFVKGKDIKERNKNEGDDIDKENFNMFSDCDGSADFCLKPIVTKFMFLSYNEKTNESLIVCQPITGRTHQIRTHLESLKYPISNDPSYNENFKEEYLSKSKYLRFVNPQLENNMHSYDRLSEEAAKNILHEQNVNKINDAEENSLVSNSEKYNQFPLIPFLNTSFNWLFDDYINLHNEYEQNFLKNYFFKQISNVSYHSSGIFLHSCRYSWEKVFDVFTLIPNWCNSFWIPPKVLTFLTYGNLFENRKSI